MWNGHPVFAVSRAFMGSPEWYRMGKGVVTVRDENVGNKEPALLYIIHSSQLQQFWVKLALRMNQSKQNILYNYNILIAPWISLCSFSRGPKAGSMFVWDREYTSFVEERTYMWTWCSDSVRRYPKAQVWLPLTFTYQNHINRHRFLGICFWEQHFQ